MAIFSNLTGTMQKIFKLGKNGASLEYENGKVLVKNYASTNLIPISIGDPVLGTDATTLNYTETYYLTKDQLSLSNGASLINTTQGISVQESLDNIPLTYVKKLDLSASTGAALVGTAGGITLQAFLNNIPLTYIKGTDLSATTGAGLVGTTEGITVQAAFNNIPLTYIKGTDLSATTGAGLVGTTDGITVQAALNAKTNSVDLSSSTGAGLIGTRLGSTVQASLDNIPLTYVKGSDLSANTGATLVGTSDGITVQASLNSKTNSVDLSSSTGSALVGYKRKKLVEYMDTAQSFSDSNGVSIWEFSNLITNKPTSDPQTWDWSPALQGLADYCISYVSQTAVNAAMFGSKDGYLTPGVFPLYSTVNVTRYGSSNGSLQTVFRLSGAGRTSSVLQTMTAGMTGIIASNCSVVFDNLGMRAGSTDQVGIQLGLQTVWAPVAHAIFNRFGTSGFVQGTLSYLLFDSTFIDCFWQNIASATGGTGSYGVRFAVYTGPQNGGTAGDGSGDGSNQILFVRPTIETSSDDSFMISIEGKNGSYPTHSITVVGGHLETHNLKAKIFNMRNSKYITFRDTTLSQNGDTSLVTTMWRAGFVENCQNVLFDHVHITTTNRLAAYANTDTVMVKILGTCQNVNFRDTHFIGPYQNNNSTKHRLDYLIDYTEANLLKRSFDVTGCVCGDNQSREITDRIRIGSLSGIHDYRFDVDETTGSASVYYSSNITDVPDGSIVWQVTPSGVIKTAQNLQIGAMSSSAVTRGIEYVNNGDQATTIASVLSDNVGRVYIKSVSGAQEWVMGSVAFNPTTTAAHTLGTSAAYPSNIYSQNAVTVVSDENYKDSITAISENSDNDKLITAVGSVPYSIWKLKSAIAQKGEENARWHVGVIAQQVRDAIIAEGLDWTKYGLITFESHSQVVTLGDNGFYYPVLNDGDMSNIPVTKDGYIDPIVGADAVISNNNTITYTREIYMLRMEEFMVLRMAYIEKMYNSTQG